MSDQKDLFKTLIDLLDGIAEVFVGSTIRPLITTHARAEHAMEQLFRQLIQAYKPRIPAWMLRTPVVTCVRLGLAIPTIVLVSWRQTVLPACLVLVAHLATFLESALAQLDAEHDLSEMKEESEHGHSEEESFGKFVPNTTSTLILQCGHMSLRRLCARQFHSTPSNSVDLFTL